MKNKKSLITTIIAIIVAVIVICIGIGIMASGEKENKVIYRVESPNNNVDSISV